MAAAVRIRITLPGVDAKEQRKRPASRSPTKRPPTSGAARVDVGLSFKLEERSESSTRGALNSQLDPSQSKPPSPDQQIVINHKHDIAAPAPPVLHTPELIAEQTFIPKVDTETTSQATRGTAKQTFMPGLSSVASSFSKAKPRVYRSRFSPADAMKKQTQCNVVSTGDSTAEVDDSSSYLMGMSNQMASRSKALTSKRGCREEYGPQEKVSVVSLAELDDEAVLMLDFRATSRPRRRVSPNEANERKEKSDGVQYSLRFLAWSSLSEAQRRIELMAATKSRCVREDASRDEIFIPSLKDFESSEVKVQLSVHSFARWFSALQNHHQWIRERFLLEELVFAAEDPAVHSEMVTRGLSVPSSECTGVSSSSEWHAFVSWYSYGKQINAGDDIDESLLYKERLEARGRFLKQRLQSVAEVERKLAEDGFGPAAELLVFVFEHFKWPSSEESENAMSWEHTSLANREKEVALALLDPDIHVAAMTQEVELPDLSGASLDDFDLLALAGRFVPWWKAAGNKSRQEFLNKEVEEAAADASIRELLTQELGDEDGAELSSENFLKAYFKSDQTRLTFLKRKLFYMKRKSRIASVAKYGKLPAPIVFETLPRPLSMPFFFPDLEPPPVEEASESEEETLIRLAEETIAEEERLITEAADKQAEEDKLNRLDDEDELKRTASELELMAREDTLSREFNAQMAEAESDDDDDGKSLTPPKRTDFSRSYFFGNLPQRFRIPQSRWNSGSGIDNGDEEIEEEERLEQERERQRLLDLQEAERLAEEEKRAERLRIEKEREDKALQMRRVRQVELRKVLIHQSELEARRRAERELKRISVEAEKMLAEEITEKQRLGRLAREQAEMTHEDQLAFHVRKLLREATARVKRLQLSELTLMRAEDNRSRVAEKEQMLRERDEDERRSYLTELYASFEPFFASTSEPSEEFLPSIQRRCLERERRQRARVKTAPYTVPYAETLVMDEVGQEPYLARDSRKFNTLIGLPVRSSHSRVRTAHIPSELEIVRLQRKAALGLDDEDRAETPLISPPTSPSSLPALAPQRLRQKTKARLKKSQLSDITPLVESHDKLTGINEVGTHEAKRTHVKTKVSESSNQQPQAALPFFRGNMIIRGESKQPARAKDYAYRS